jgi:hypothetical protein
MPAGASPLVPACDSWPILIDQLTDEFRTANDIEPPARGVHPSALIRAKGLQIIGVSEDKADARKKFQEKCKLPFSLVADSDGLVAKAFGVPTVARFAKRQSFLIKDGTIAWRDLNASTKNQAADVRQAMASLDAK